MPSPEPTPAAKPAPTPAVSDVLVGIDGNGGFQNFPSYFYATALQAFLKQLSQDKLVKVTDGGDMTRGEATKKAKGEKEGYVIHLQLRLESMNPSARSEDARDAIIEYIVMAPTTTKIVASGRIYARAIQNRGILRAPTSGIYNDYRLEEAAKLAAEEVDEYFKHHRTGPFD